MRDAFPGYFAPSPAEYDELWTTGLVVLDTNSLLNLYRYSASAREQFLSVLGAIEDRLWIPQQVGYEFLERRFDVIREQERAYGELRDALGSSEKSLENVANKYRRHPALDIAELLGRVNEHFEALRNELLEREAAHPLTVANARDSDPIADRVTRLFTGRVGPAFSVDYLQTVFKDGAERYAKKIPPGYKDEHKGEPGKFGDLVLWKQILAHCEDEGRATIFVTDDRKEDWWRIFGGQRLGPRPELVDEFFDVTGKRIHLYSPEQFLREAESRLGLALVTDETLGEVERVSTVDPERVRAVIERRLNDLGKQRDRLRRLVDFRSSPGVGANQLTRAQERRTQAAREVADLEASLQIIPELDRILVGPNLEQVLNSARRRLVEADRYLTYTQQRGSDSNPYPEQLAEVEEEISEIEATLAALDGASGAA